MRNLLRFFHNIWVYRHELWNDRHWDEAYLVAFVERKLKLMHEELSDPNKSMAIHTQKELRRLATAAEYAKRINDNNYYDRMPNLASGDWLKRLNDPKSSREMSRICKDITDLENRDWNGLWDTIKKYGRTWWD